MKHIDYMFEEWHARAKNRDVDGLLRLYDKNAILESPLVPAILNNKSDGILRGIDEIKLFLEQGTKRRPNELIKWYRTGKYLTNGKTLVWEYPRKTPDGEQVDILELMEINDKGITHHRIYWGWKGCSLIAKSLVENSE